MGFLGIGGSDRKSAYRRVSDAAAGIRTDLGNYRPQYGSIRGGIQAYQTDRNNTAESYPTIRSGWTNEINEPFRPDQTYKEGYDPATVQAMRTSQSDIVAGGRTRASNEINRQAAAQGMQNTGAAMRSVMAMEPTWTAKSQAGRRTADLDAAEAARLDYQKNQDRIASDYWNGRQARQQGLQGLDTFEQGREAFNRNSFRDQLQALNDETGTYNMDIATLNPEMKAYEGMYQPGFWGKLGSSFATGLGGGVGAAIGKRF